MTDYPKLCEGGVPGYEKMTPEEQKQYWEQRSEKEDKVLYSALYGEEFMEECGLVPAHKTSKEVAIEHAFMIACDNNNSACVEKILSGNFITIGDNFIKYVNASQGDAEILTVLFRYLDITNMKLYSDAITTAAKYNQVSELDSLLNMDVTVFEPKTEDIDESISNEEQRQPSSGITVFTPSDHIPPVTLEKKIPLEP